MSDLDRSIARVYASPLEEFVRQRDSLVKELTAAGNRADAATVKALRKPSRLAWALNVAAGNTAHLSRLDAGVAAMREAQSSGGDVRTALAGFREAVREFAEYAAQQAQRAGHGLETATLVNAVLAVIGRTDSLAALRQGHLAEIPEGGGLDFLAALPSSLPSSGPDAPVAARARAEARERSEEAQAALREAESRLRLAEMRQREAESEVKAARRAYERARLDAEAAAGEA